MWCILLGRMRAPIAVSATSASTRMSRAAAPACAVKLAGKRLSLTLHVLAATNLVHLKWAQCYDYPCSCSILYSAVSKPTDAILHTHCPFESKWDFCGRSARDARGVEVLTDGG